jgi:UDP-2,3-diacylglucosamine pyrophosphatase LpxH
MILSDAHIPFQSDQAINIALKIHQRCRPEEVILNGDMLDFSELSHFVRDKLVDRPIEESIDDLVKIIKKLQRYSNVILHEGNHEARLQKYLLSNAPEVEHLLKFDKLVNDKLDTPIKIIKSIGRDTMAKYFDDQLLIGHFNKALKNSAYTAKALVEQYKMNIVQGHTHRLGVYYTTGAERTLIGVEGGCLCCIRPNYTHTPDWMNGLLMARDHENIETIYINEGKTIYRGKVYKG